MPSKNEVLWAIRVFGVVFFWRVSSVSELPVFVHSAKTLLASLCFGLLCKVPQTVAQPNNVADPYKWYHASIHTLSHGHTDGIAEPYKWCHTSIHTLSHGHTDDIAVIQMISHIYTHVITRPHRQYRRAIQMISHICTNVVTQPYKQHTLHALQTSLCSQTNITYKHHRTIRTSWNNTNNIMQPS